MKSVGILSKPKNISDRFMAGYNFAPNVVVVSRILFPSLAARGGLKLGCDHLSKAFTLP